MSSYLVLREVSEVLRTILFEQMSADAVTSAIVLNEADIVFTNPTQTAQAGNGRLSPSAWSISKWSHEIFSRTCRPKIAETTSARARSA